MISIVIGIALFLGVNIAFDSAFAEFKPFRQRQVNRNIGLNPVINQKVIDFCHQNDIQYHIKAGTPLSEKAP